MGRDLQYREKYDICVSRAVANLSTLSEYCVPFIKVGGLFVSYKSEVVEEEVKKAERALLELNCDKAVVSKLTLPQENLIRSFVQIRKTESLIKKYPRKAGMPSKNPL